MDLIDNALQLKSWLPISVKWKGSEPTIEWIYASDDRFTEPFFDQTIERLLRKPFNLVFRQRTEVDALRMAATALPTIKPTGFIYHMSRCGSTLVSRMLSSLEQNVVISEAFPLDWMIRADVRRPDITADEHVNWIRWMMAALAQQRTAAAANFFVKFDSWHTLYFDAIQRAFPDVPWIFLYRNPSEVLVSHEKQRGATTVPGLIEHRIEGFSLVDSLRFPSEEYPAFVLAAICRAALTQRDNEKGMFVNYTQLPEFVFGALQQHFGVEFSAADIATMKTAASYNAKSPEDKFTGDTEEKQRAAQGELDAIADKYFAEIYDELEAARR